MYLSSPVVSQGDGVTVTCEVLNKLNTTNTFVFVKKAAGDDEVRIASNHIVEDRFQQTGRYRIERNATDRMRHVWYTLRISGTS